MTHCKTDRCAQGVKACPTPINCGLMTQNGGEFVDTRCNTFRPDFGIEHIRVRHEITFMGFCIVVISVSCVVWFCAYRFLGA